MLNIHTVNIVGGGGLKSEWSCQEIHAGGFSCIEEHKFQYTSSFLRRAQSFNFNLSLMSGFDSESSMSSDSTRCFYNKSGIVNPLNMSQSCSNIFSRSASTNELNHDQTLTNNRTPESNSNPTNNYLNNKKISLNDYVSLRAKSSSQLSSTSNQTSKQVNELNTQNGSELVASLKQEPMETMPGPTDTATTALEQHHSPKVLIKAEPEVMSPKRSQTNKKLPSLSLIDELKKRMNPKANKENNVDSYGNSFDDDDDENEEEEEKSSTESDKDENNKSRKRHHSKSKSKSKHRHKKKSMKSKSKKKKRQSARTSDESDSEPTRPRRHHHHHHHHKRKKSN